MYINYANAVNKLHDTLDQCETLYDVLYKYTGDKNTVDIISELKCNDTLWYMADQQDINESAMEDWINDHWDSFVSCKIFQDRGPTGWPVVEISCLDMLFYLDWVV